MATKAESETVTAHGEILDAETYKTLAGNIFMGGAVSLMMSMAQDTGMVKVLMDAPTPLSSQQIATQLRLKERYVRETLSSLAAVRVIQVERGTGGKDEPPARFFLHPTHREAFHQTAVFSMYTTSAGARFPAINSRFPQDTPGDVMYGKDEFRLWEHVSDFTKENIAQAILKTPGLREQLEKGIQALEIGSGSAIFMCHMAAMFPKSHFLLTDLTPDGLDRAKATAKKLNLSNVTFQILNIFQIPENMNNSFDWITAIDVMHDIPHPLKGLGGVKNMLKPGGHFSMVDMFMSTYLAGNIGNPLAAVLYSLSTLLCIPESYQQQDSEALGACWGKQHALELVEKAGLRVIDLIDSLPGSPGMFAVCMCQKAG